VQQWLAYVDRALSCWLPHSIRYFLISASCHIYIAQWSRAIGEIELGQKARLVVQLTCDRPLAVSSHEPRTWAEGCVQLAAYACNLVASRASRSPSYSSQPTHHTYPVAYPPT